MDTTEKLRKKISQLERLTWMEFEANDPERAAFLERRVWLAKAYIKELNDVINIATMLENVRIVPTNIFEKQIARADFADEEFSGSFARITVVQNFPYSPVGLIWTMPLSEFSKW